MARVSSPIAPEDRRNPGKPFQEIDLPDADPQRMGAIRPPRSGGFDAAVGRVGIVRRFRRVFPLLPHSLLLFLLLFFQLFLTLLETVK
jgi:hypothetical protein